MRELATALINHFKSNFPDDFNDSSLVDGGKIFFGDEQYTNENTLNMSVSSVGDIDSANGDYVVYHEISLSITFYGNLNHMETYEKALGYGKSLRNPKTPRCIHNNIRKLELGTMVYSDKVEDRFVFSMDVTVFWDGEL